MDELSGIISNTDATVSKKASQLPGFALNDCYKIISSFSPAKILDSNRCSRLRKVTKNVIRGLQNVRGKKKIGAFFALPGFL
jgi:hypothetical protein